MKKLLVILAACFAFIGTAFAAVDLNTATQAQLESVKGIGPAKAKAIIDYRTKNGPFKSVDELDNVKGFGDKTVDKVRSEISVGGRSSTKAADKPVEKAAEKTKPADMAKPAEKAADKGTDKAKTTDKAADKAKTADQAKTAEKSADKAAAADKDKADKKTAKKAKKADKDKPADDKKEAGKK